MSLGTLLRRNLPGTPEVAGIVLLGAGGHAREVVEILRAQFVPDGEHTIRGYVDEYAAPGELRDGVPVLGGWSWFDDQNLASIRVITAVGTPNIIARFAQLASARGLTFISAIAPTAVISPRARLGLGVTVFPQVVVNTAAVIGDHAILNTGVSVSHDSVVGRHSNLNPGARLAGNVQIGERCYIGMGASVIQNTPIGSGTIVGAGAVVTTDLGSRVTAVGVPATVIKQHAQEIAP